MLSSIIAAIAANVPQALINAVFKSLSKWSLEKAIRGAVTDLILDEIENTLEEQGIAQDEVKDIVEDRKSAVKKEVKIRIGAIFKALKS